MCGISCSIGSLNAKEVVLEGLNRLEYRGYDSSGMLLISQDDKKIFKSLGRIKDLEKKLDEKKYHIGIGHTRWATHGKVTTLNAHPHTSNNEVVTLVHNGVIENYEILKEELKDKGVVFYSETDTEIICNLLEIELQNNDILHSLINLQKKIIGSYALGIYVGDNTIYGLKNKSPMLIGLGQDFNLLASDALAMIKYTNEFIEIHDHEIIVLKEKSVDIYDLNLEKINRNSFVSNLKHEDIELGINDFYMLKEIDEQPIVIRNLIKKHQEGSLIDEKVIKLIKESDRVYIVASGTSYNAGLISKKYFEKLNIPTEVYLGSEFAYDIPLISQKPVFIFLSQSGETADSRSAMQVIKNKYPIITITNVENSTLAREADFSCLLHAGIEIAVASTKAYVAQITFMALLAASISNDDISFELGKVANAIENVFSNKEKIKEIVKNKIIHAPSLFYIGRSIDYLTCLEAALKLKEISYIHTEAMPAGELKHGTIALISDLVPVIGIITHEKTALLMRSSLSEVECRNALCITIVKESLANENDDFIIDNVLEDLCPIVSVVVTQLIAFYAALSLGLDIDKPRNLAKSVTVE